MRALWSFKGYSISIILRLFKLLNFQIFKGFTPALVPKQGLVHFQTRKRDKCIWYANVYYIMVIKPYKQLANLEPVSFNTVLYQFRNLLVGIAFSIWQVMFRWQKNDENNQPWHLFLIYNMFLYWFNNPITFLLFLHERFSILHKWTYLLKYVLFCLFYCWLKVVHVNIT